MTETQRRNAAELVLSVAPIQFDAETKVAVKALSYEGKEQLAKLRLDYRATHVFRRTNATEILAVPIVSDAPDIDGELREITLGENLSLVAVIARNALLNFLHGLGRPVFGYHPVTFLATSLKHNLLQNAAPFGVETPPWLAVRPLYTADIRIFCFDGQQPFLGIACNVRTCTVIDTSCDRLLHDGLSLDGLYVCRRVSNKDPRIAPRLELLGKVNSVSGDTLHLADARQGSDTVSAKDVYLEPKFGAFRRCLDLAFKSRANSVRTKLEQEIATINSGPGRLEHIQKAVSYLESNPLELTPGVQARVGQLFDHPGTASFPRIENLNPPTFVFDPAGTKVDRSSNTGLNRFGPYDQQTFDKSQPRVCVICQNRYRGQVEQLVHKFLNGIPRAGTAGNAFESGLIRKYRLRAITPTFFEANGNDVGAYERASHEAVEHAVENQFRWDLAIVQSERSFQDLFGAQNPYLITKKIFLTQQVPVQTFVMDTAALPDARLSFALNNMALATYAKISGVPWLMKSSPAMAHELVFGLGSANIGFGRLGERRRVVGITTVFSSDGNYWLSTLTRSVAIADYREALLDSLQRSVSRLKQDMNWQPRDPVRLIFHAFKPFKDCEADAVKSLMSELGDYSVDYAFVHVKELHPYFLFDRRQPGVETYGGRSVKGVFAPNRGQSLILSDKESLLVLTGPAELKRANEGMPRPVLLQLHRESSFKDIMYLTRQAYHFASHSWRSFSNASMPVTIFYSSLVARMLGKLSTIPTWDADVMIGNIGRTRWFL